MILLIDNYDSFVYNLARYFVQLGFETMVVRNDQISTLDIQQLSPTHIVVSPGPCDPNSAGISLSVIDAFHRTIPILGVCLGHQAIAQAFGGQVIRADAPVHGKSSLIQHATIGLFAGLPNPLRVGRYHSLIVSEDKFPECLEITARTELNEIMAIRHREFPVYGVQFHPESVNTDHGYELLQNFVATTSVYPSIIG